MKNNCSHCGSIGWNPILKAQAQREHMLNRKLREENLSLKVALKHQVGRKHKYRPELCSECAEAEGV